MPKYSAETVHMHAGEPWNYEWKAMLVLPYHEVVIVKHYDSLQETEFIRACTWNAFLDFLKIFNGTIILYEDDFTYIKEKCPDIFSFHPFFYHHCLYKYFYDDIETKTDHPPDACLFLVDESTTCLFVKPEEGYVQFTIQNSNGTTQILSDINKGKYNYSDKVFFDIDACEDDYEEVIKTVLQIPNVKGRCQGIINS